MTKRFWAALTGVFFIITLASAIFINMALKHHAVKDVPLKQVPPPSQSEASPPSAPVSEQNAAPEKEDLQEPFKPSKPLVAGKGEPVIQKSAELNKNVSTIRNIGFAYHNQKAKEVFIVGDFNSGEKLRMEKKGRGWAIGVKLHPGTYQYQFIVDGKRLPDPNNKKISKDGKSILVVKPLTSK